MSKEKQMEMISEEALNEIAGGLDARKEKKVKMAFICTLFGLATLGLITVGCAEILAQAK